MACVFQTPTELATILSTKTDQVLENLAERMFIYAMDEEFNVQIVAS